MSEVREILERHLKSVFDLDVSTYHTTCADDLTVYEWYITPHRIDGLAFHEQMMTEAGEQGKVRMAWDAKDETRPEKKTFLRYDLANYYEQRFGDAAICSYTLLVTRSTSQGVKVRSHNESRVVVKIDDAWKVVHVHKSPAWSAPFFPPA